MRHIGGKFLQIYAKNGKKKEKGGSICIVLSTIASFCTLEIYKMHKRKRMKWHCKQGWAFLRVKVSAGQCSRQKRTSERPKEGRNSFRFLP